MEAKGRTRVEEIGGSRVEAGRRRKVKSKSIRNNFKAS